MSSLEAPAPAPGAIIVITFIDDTTRTLPVVAGYQMPRSSHGLIGPIYSTNGTVLAVSSRNVKCIELREISTP